MTDRQREILFAIIEEYAELATPVGSVTLAKLFDVSSATIRAEMVKLEEMGLIKQPHTSAGRVPTDAGYRLYVNQLQEKMENKSAAEKEEPEMPKDRTTKALATRIQAQTRADYAIRSAVDSLVDLTGNLGLATVGDQLYISGFGNLFSQPEFSQANQVQAVAKLLDNIKPWLREVSPNEAINVYIGTENPIGKTSNVSLIVSRFRSPFSDRSYIGVLGPTRQSYRRVMSLVRNAGIMLEDILL
ncbi:transcriptional regulator [Candidatus Saccharibacteria bacterium]|nr:transcriptional regulator [Candidatus Saccharibacteria bacterium]MDO4730181.1 transcriptional regulator [Candidatus Saccharibacteria bacterium]